MRSINPIGSSEPTHPSITLCPSVPLRRHHLILQFHTTAFHTYLSQADQCLHVVVEHPDKRQMVAAMKILEELQWAHRARYCSVWQLRTVRGAPSTSGRWVQGQNTWPCCRSACGCVGAHSSQLQVLLSNLLSSRAALFDTSLISLIFSHQFN